MSSRVGFLVVLRNIGHRKVTVATKTVNNHWKSAVLGCHSTAVKTDYSSNGAESLPMSGRHASENAWTSSVKNALTLIYIKI